MLAEVESRQDLFSIAVDGISLWRLLRFEVALQLQNLGLRRISMGRAALLKSLPRAAGQYLLAPRGFRYLGKTSNSGLRGLDERGYFDIYFDDLIDGLPGGAKLSSLDAGGYEANERGAYREPVFDDTAVIVASAVLGRIRAPREGARAFGELAGILDREFDLPEFAPAHIARKYSVFVARRALYRRILRRLGARSVLAANTGQFALCMAARDIGIPFVEMQHGLFTSSHPDCLPARALDASADLMLPDLLTVYGDYAAGLIAETALARHGKVRAVGNPAIEKGRDLRARSFRPDRQSPVVTLTAQGIGDKDTAAFLAEFLRRVPGDLTLNIRLHPGYDSRGDFERSGVLGDRRVRLMPGQSTPATHEVIALSDLHLSVFSTCHYDALGIGTPTMVLPGAGHEAVADLYEKGHARLLDTPAGLAEIISKGQWSDVPEATSRHFFQPGFLENMRALLNELQVAESGPK
ncbi:MAG: hypothetical protein IBJ07_06565 [Rhizobiaceae bacterium]|nr:hypothetical protein [Rhizobiaceae bacterium]